MRGLSWQRRAAGVVASRLSYANVTATVALVAALGGGAYAATVGIPDSNGVFHGCVNKQSGVLRVVRSASSCRPARKRHGRVVFAGEFAIAWNQQGRPGANGINGINGRNGTDGTNGINGTNGTNGANGATKVVVRSASFTAAAATDLIATCGPGEVATGGGIGRSNGTSTADLVTSSFPSNSLGQRVPDGSTPTAWDAGFRVPSGATTITTYVICASP